MQNIVFTKAGMSDLTIERARKYPLKNDLKINQKRYLTESLKPKVVSFGSNQSTIELSLEGLTQDNLDGAINGLETWFSDVLIGWSLNSFDMTDETGLIETVRLWQDDYKTVQKTGDLFSLKLKLRVE